MSNCPRCSYVTELARNPSLTEAAVLPKTPPHSDECPKSLARRSVRRDDVNTHRPRGTDAWSADLLRGVLVTDD